MKRVVHLPSGRIGTAQDDGDRTLVRWDIGHAGRVDAEDLRALDDCASCSDTQDQCCPESRRSCDHHCDHSWTHDRCCWCNKTWGENSPAIDHHDTAAEGQEYAP